ncbi:DHH family phosphoesterase [Candidatus Woesearchaeota archaeon]|nr:DHH family phosphoesterase [Candidatus Woesearchaeota archaeon]
MDNLIKNGSDKFLVLNKNKPLRIITHNDADGLTSGSILIIALSRDEYKFVASNVKQLDDKTIEDLAKEDYETFIFTDLGSGYLGKIKKHFKDKNIFILDHHEIDKNDFALDSQNIVHINPKLINENDYNYVSGAGVVYLFIKFLNKRNVDLSYLALIGAIGDLQCLNKGLNSIILQDAINSGKIEIKKGLKLFGYQSRAIHKVLQYSSDPFIPGVSGQEDGAVNFLNELGIDINNGKHYRKLTDLDKEEMQRLIAGIIMKRMGIEKDPDDVIGDLYLLKDEEDDSIIKDAREFSTVLNCCGRMDAFSIGVGLCFGNKNIRSKAEELLKSYRIEIINALNYYYDNINDFPKSDCYIIINAKDNIRDTIIGTLMTILSKNNNLGNMVLIGMAYREDSIKISARISGKVDIDLREVLMQIAPDYGTLGGHKQACGGLIKRDEEKLFIDRATKVLNSMEMAQR